MISGFVRVCHYARQESWRSEAASGIVEFAIIVPVMIALMIGAVDFARVFYEANVVSQAVRSGVQYGARTGKSTDFNGMQTATSDAASDLSGVTATATCFSECSSSVGTPRACNFTCPNGTRKLTYVKVVGNYTFRMIFGFPVIPSTIPISRTAIMQVP
jgi:Flp pilus assembly protein TadG